MVNVCPEIPDTWMGGRSATAKILGIDPKTLDKYAMLGPRQKGISFSMNKGGKKRFSGREIKRFWRDF